MSRIQGEAEVRATVKAYMEEQNRPYNATAIFLNLRQTMVVLQKTW